MAEVNHERSAGILDQSEARIRASYSGAEDVHIIVDPRSRGIDNFLRVLRGLRTDEHDVSLLNGITSALCAIAVKPNADIIATSMLAFLEQTRDSGKIKTMSTFVRVLAEQDYLGGRQDYFPRLPRSRDGEKRAQRILDVLASRIR